MVRVPLGLIDRIDGVRGSVPRERWVRLSLEAMLDRLEGAPEGQPAPSSVPRPVVAEVSDGSTPASDGGARDARPPAPPRLPARRATGKRPDSFKPIPKGK